ncbi:dTDP-glucose 4,6-dehydratase [Deferribacter autotrophicus]|uniref:dTDP-glucose 4,6-dehydratase n=1 Tax=Deferribacter autotrophicus TaxID=500465 RepID=A0A5A8F4D3_9BACT|nr:dTDP-glucose 4,6-dehydratase [Deferribacter autotrophicus]KAA0258994.1 dTDP-glucose 4,6-dehydratase [Deferribacter autotrophicus]
MSCKTILVTGGCGFIGTNFIKYVFYDTDFDGIIINIDKLTYAGRKENLIDIETNFKERYIFKKLDICDFAALEDLFTQYKIDCIVHFAAESHVDKSITGPQQFIYTNIIGTFNLLEAIRKYWACSESNNRFIHISTDEVYGSLGQEGYFYESSCYNPRSPYSASKASSDHLVMSYYYTYNLPVIITNCSNNYGPYQYPEKLIPLMILNMLKEKPLPVYGDGQNVRDWLYVKDHCEAIWLVLGNGKVGEKYNIGGENEWRNIDLVNYLCEIVAEKLGKHRDYFKKYITFVKDRLGHDKRYAINCDKIKKELNWSQRTPFDEGISNTVEWYIKKYWNR